MADNLQLAAQYVNSSHEANARGDFQSAVDFSRKALQLAPYIAEAWYNLGVAQRGLGQVSNAIKSLRNACKRTRDIADAQNNIGLEFLELNAYQDAEQCFKRALELDPDHALSHSNYGKLLVESNRLPEAVMEYQRAASLMPRSAQIQSNYAGILMEVYQFEEAEEVCRRAIELDPASSDAWTKLGNALAEQGRHTEALASYEKALEIKPGNVETYYKLGFLQSQLGHESDAIANYLRVLELKPDYAKAYLSLGELRKYDVGDVRLRQIETLLTQPRISDTDRICLKFALAKAQDDIGSDKRAIALYREANRLRKKQLGYHINQDKKLFHDIRAIFEGEKPAINATAKIRDYSINPVFIVGMPRSGTTLVEQILASHSRVYGAGELDCLAQEALAVVDRYRADHVLIDIVDSSEHIMNRYLSHLQKLNAKENIITDKTPLNFRWLGFVMAALPDVRIINLNRNPTAICWSNYKIFFQSEAGFAYDLSDLAEYYCLYTELMSFWRSRFPGRIYDLNYEALTENQEDETGKLLRYCGLEWEDQCLEFEKADRAVKTASLTQVRKKMYKGSSEAWRKYERHLGPIMKFPCATE